MAIHSSENNCNNSIFDFTSKILSCINFENINIPFTIGVVKSIMINGKMIIIWQDAKGNVSYNFDITNKNYFTTSTSKLSNVLSNHFQCNTEAINNEKDYLKKIANATTGLNKAVTDLQRYSDYVSYNEADNEINEEKKSIPLASIDDMLNVLDDSNIKMQKYQPIVSQQPEYNQEQLYSDTIKLSDQQLKTHKQTYYIYINNIPVVHKEEFRPDIKQAFYIENGLTCKNSYIASKYMYYTLLKDNLNINNSVILMFILFMAKLDINNAIKILTWLAYSFNLTVKFPYILALHSEEKSNMNLFFEEIVTPLLNHEHCEKVEIGDLDKKSLPLKLHEKAVYNFHNITTPRILDIPAKELTRKLIYKNDYKLNRKVITTRASILVTSTTKYIPLIAKDVPTVLINVASSLDGFCNYYNIENDYYKVAKIINGDLDNFVSLLKSMNINTLNSFCNFNHYEKHSQDNNIIDGDTDILNVFNTSIQNKDEVIFEKLETIAPKLYRTLIEDFKEDRVNRQNLILYFTNLFGEGIYTKEQNRKIIKDLRELSSEKEPFENEETFQIGKIVYYQL